MSFLRWSTTTGSLTTSPVAAACKAAVPGLGGSRLPVPAPQRTPPLALTSSGTRRSPGPSPMRSGR
eukprot:12332302-Alexandrium_andersonii.AAC.1